MNKVVSGLLGVLALCAVASPSIAAPSIEAPVATAVFRDSGPEASVQTVQYRRHGYAQRRHYRHHRYARHHRGYRRY